MFAIDVVTERTWTTELPETYAVPTSWNSYWIVPATSEDGRLSVISLPVDRRNEVWVLGGGNKWMLQRVINMHQMTMKVFCPRSGCCLFRDTRYNDVLVDVNTGSLRPTERFGDGRVTLYSYEMDWSTYISKMKYF